MTGESFPTDIKNCMKDCILSVMWARKDIFAFFRDHSCTQAELDEIKKFEEEKLARGRMIDIVFERLSGRADAGLGQFRAMLKALTEWSHFDSYYFETLAKLDRRTADRHLNHLKQLVEIRDGKIREERKAREDAARRQQTTGETRESLLKRFLELFQSGAKPQERGYKFEALLRDIAKLAQLEVTNPFKCTGEQIDGGIKYDGENYLVEAKWHDRSASTTPLYTFAHKVEGKMYGRGIFISVNGFMPDPVQGLMKGKAIRTVLVDGQDLTLVLEGHLTLSQMLDRKVRAAQLRGEIYIHPLTDKPKYPPSES